MTVVIPTHNRIEITTVNINLLLVQGFTVVLVVSSVEELRYYSKFNVHVIRADNSPLGLKWQKGVDYARRLNPDSIVILGSDDLLSKNFKDQFDFVATIYQSKIVRQLLHNVVSYFAGFKQWYVWSSETLYHLEYLADQPLGGARIYPRILLDILDWKLFDTTKNKLLDDFAWNKIKASYGHRIINEPHILAVKGDWDVLNPFDPRHPNVKVLASYIGSEATKIMKDKFNYDPKGVL